MTAPHVAPLPPGCLTDPSRPIEFTFDGRPVRAIEGQSIAAALYAAGVRIFSRSFKYHRPRGLFCVSGDCPNCLMNVDGRPNVATCVEPARQGQVVRSQNAWPGLRFDLLRVFDRLHAFLPVGFYYKRFHRPRWMWPVFERVVRRVAGLGRVDISQVPDLETELEHIHTEVCVVGGGPAGLAAASEAATAGAEVLLLDRQPRLGGHLLYDGTMPSEVEELIAAAQSHPRIRTLTGTSAFGLYEGNMLAAFQGRRLLRIRGGHIIFCTGGRQQVEPFTNNDLPGIFLARGVLRLARLYGVRAGRRAVVLADSDDGYRQAGEIARLGIEVAAVVDYRPADPNKAGGPTSWRKLETSRIIEALGGSRLQGVRVRQLIKDANGGFQAHEEDIDCDLLCIATALQPASELLRQGGARYYLGVWQPDPANPGLSAAGSAAGSRDWIEPQWTWDTLRRSFICLCEDVTETDVTRATAEGFDHIETLKRYTTATMGPCQGRMCARAFTASFGLATGWTPESVGRTTARPPAAPVELAVLAAERRHHPVRRTPMHHWHQAAGARWLDAGQWKRPDNYGDPAAEVRAVRSAAGLIDVSTLGKIEVIGPDAVTLLERVYINTWADLASGRTRYGVMCTEEGIVFDDGVAARLGPEQFYLTATTGNAESVFQWLELWRATWRLNAIVLNRTSAFAAMNLAGPRAREVLARLSDADVTADAFPYLAQREIDVAGVPCRVLRVGFVGELGYEIHCPSCYGQHVWDAILAAGSDVGLRPFGVEAQRILRLEKGHLIVGQDTDALASPLGAGLERLVRFSKPLFHGREPLWRLKAKGLRERLVGFQLADADAVHGDTSWVRDLEGCQVVEQGRPVGRVTSARHSPTLEKTVGLAWVPVASSTPGTRFLIRHEGTDLSALVVPLPFYDPEGKRLRS
jgi:sarcosine oxidase subunit alpha